MGEEDYNSFKILYKVREVTSLCIFLESERSVLVVCTAPNIKEMEIFCVVKISNSKAIYFDILVILGYANHILFMCFVMYDIY